MPTPIDHQDTTLTEINRQSGVQIEHRVYAQLSTSVRPDDTTVKIGRKRDEDGDVRSVFRHELRIFHRGARAGSVLWKCEATYGGAQDPYSDTTVDSDPVRTLTVEEEPPAAAETWTPALAGGWDYVMSVWAQGEAGFDLTLTRPPGASSWTIRLSKAGAALYEGALDGGLGHALYGQPIKELDDSARQRISEQFPKPPRGKR